MYRILLAGVIMAMIYHVSYLLQLHRIKMK
jgi:hypothetical protein